MGFVLVFNNIREIGEEIMKSISHRSKIVRLVIFSYFNLFLSKG